VEGREADRWHCLVHLAPVREEEEGGWLGHEVSWAESSDGPTGCWAGWAETEKNYFLNKI
jgi:hypothetical protein